MKGIDFRNDVLPLKDKLFRLALRTTLNRTEAEDITQETLIRIWEKRDTWHQIEDMEAYASTICRRLALDYLKHAKLSSAQEMPDDSPLHPSPFTLHPPSSDPLPDEALDRQQKLSIIRQLIDELPEMQRTVMLLRDIEGHRYDEIAQLTGLSETQVRVYLHRARTKLKKICTSL